MNILACMGSWLFWIVLLVLLASVIGNLYLFRKCCRLEDEKRTLEYELAGTYVDDIIGFDE